MLCVLLTVLYVMQTVLYVMQTKVYRLGGETDSAIRRRKSTSCDVGERPEEAGC